MPSKVWEEITQQFPKFNGEVSEWIGNFIPHLSMLGLILSHVSKWASSENNHFVKATLSLFDFIHKW